MVRSHWWIRRSQSDVRVLAKRVTAILRRIGRKWVALKVQLLGDFRVVTDSRTIESAAWRLRKASHIVKLLALTPSHRLHRERLLDLLWPDLPPESAANNMRVSLHAARHMLDPIAPASTIGLEQEWLSLSPSSPPEIDVTRFEAEAAQARRGGTVEQLQAAVDLYGGELLPDDPYEEWAIEQRMALQETYLQLLIQLGGALEGQGRFSEAIATYGQVLLTDRTLETAHRALMRAYAASGRRERAMRQFREAEAILRSELEVEPDQETVTLFRSIAAGEDVVLPDAGPGAVRPHHHAHSVAPRAEPPRLAEQRTSFVGRQGELAAISERLTSTRLLTLTGPGGIGKTRLAMRAAAALRASFDDVQMVELAGVQNPDLVPEAIATTIGAREQPDLSAVERITRAIDGRNALLVLDNCEHLLDACARIADELLRQCPNLRVLATSRQRLGVPGESVIRVPPLHVPDGTSAALGDEDEAVQLFLDRARLYNPDLSATGDNAAALVRICRATDGIPLAIELAAARLPALGLEQLADRLGDALGVLRSGPRTVDSRHQSLEAALDWSHALLAEDERQLFMQLSVFASGWSLESAEAVCQTSCETVLNGLFQLVDKSLVLAEEGPSGAVRYRMLEPVRQYARTHLERTPEAMSVRAHHSGWYVGLAEKAEFELTGPLHQFWLEQLETEHDNLRAALGWCLDNGEIESGLRMAAALWRFWEIRGHVSEGRTWLERLLVAGNDAPAGVRARAYNAAGNLAADVGDYVQSDAFYEQGLARFREIDDRTGVARVLNNLAINASEQGDFRRAEAWYEESLEISRNLGDRWQIARALNNLGAMSLYSGRYDRAEVLLGEAHQLWLTLGDRSAYAQSLDLAGELARERGDLERATALHEQTLEIRRELGDQRHVAASLHNLAIAALCRGDHEQAETLAEEALEIRREVGFQRGVVHSLACLAQAALRDEDHRRARALYRESLVIRRELGSHEALAGSLTGVAAVALAQNYPEQAVQLLASAAAIREALGSPLARVDRDIFDRTLEQSRSHLNPDAFETAWSTGREMPVEQVIDLALSITGN